MSAQASREALPRLSTENSKYGFTGETIQFDGRTFHRIIALRDITINGVLVARKGAKGGFIKNEGNLDYSSNAR